MRASQHFSLFYLYRLHFLLRADQPDADRLCSIVVNLNKQDDEIWDPHNIYTDWNLYADSHRAILINLSTHYFIVCIVNVMKTRFLVSSKLHISSEQLRKLDTLS